MKRNTPQAKIALFTLFAMLMPLLASAHDFEVNDIYYNVTSDTDLTVEVTYRGDSYDSFSDEYSGNVEIPSSVSYEGVAYGVTSVESSAFYGCCSLTSITIPEGVTSIGVNAFFRCSSLSSISIPSSVTFIPENAFVECSSLTSVTIPEGVEGLGNYAFAGCSNLTNIILPESVKSLGEFVFAGCSNLASITCKATTPPSVKNNTFNGIRTNIPLYVPTISFESYKSSLSGGWGSLFSNIQPMGTCGESLTWRITPEEVLIIEGEGDMYDYSSKENTPWYRKSFQTVEIAEGVTHIGDYAFNGCSELTVVYIPKSVTSIGDYAFYDCWKLQEIHISDIEAWCYIDFEGAECNPLYYGAGNLYLKGELVTELTIPNTITEIKDYAFTTCQSLTAITFPENLTSIGEESFYNCSSLTSINIPKSVANIGEYAFAWCPNLTSIAVADENTIYDSRNNCNAIIETFSNTLVLGCATTIIPEGITCIGESAFEYNLNLTSIVIPEGIESIERCAFYWCDNLVSIILPSSITSIGDRSFDSSSKQLDIYCYAENMPSISGSPFGNGDNLYKSTLHVPANALEDYKSTYPWSSFGTIKAIPLEKCATPKVSYEEGQVVITCDTEGVEFKTSVTVDNAHEYEESRFDLTATYTITTYTTKAKYENSDTVSVTIYWMPCTEKHENVETGILNIPSKPVLISTLGGTITLNGLADNTEVTVYDLAGTQLATTTATDGTATLATGLEVGSTAIVKIGGNSVKVIVK